MALQQELRDLFERLRKSVLLVTHDMAEAAFFSGKLVLMREGRVVQQGGYRDLVALPAEEFVREFVKAQRRLTMRRRGRCACARLRRRPRCLAADVLRPRRSWSAPRCSPNR